MASSSATLSAATTEDITPLRCITVKTGQISNPTGDPKFSVIDTFPSAISEIDADPFLMCHHFGPKVSPGLASHPDEFPIGWHPHRGMDICTYLIEGIGRHGDSLGNREEFATPGIQWISVGSGIEHAEGGGTPAGVNMQGFQIWINVPAENKMDDPSYGTHSPGEIPVIDYLDGSIGRLLAGQIGSNLGPFKTKQPVEMVDFNIGGGATISHIISPIYDNTLVHIYAGSGTILGTKVKKDNIVRLNSEIANGERSLNITADAGGLKVMLFSGKMIKEKIAWKGPFVMNTAAELETAFAEYRSGSFLKKRVPWDYKRIQAFPLKKEL